MYEAVFGNIVKEEFGMHRVSVEGVFRVGAGAGVQATPMWHGNKIVYFDRF